MVSPIVQNMPVCKQRTKFSLKGIRGFIFSFNNKNENTHSSPTITIVKKNIAELCKEPIFIKSTKSPFHKARINMWRGPGCVKTALRGASSPPLFERSENITQLPRNIIMIPTKASELGSSPNNTQAYAVLIIGIKDPKGITRERSPLVSAFTNLISTITSNITANRRQLKKLMRSNVGIPVSPIMVRFRTTPILRGIQFTR